MTEGLTSLPGEQPDPDRAGEIGRLVCLNALRIDARDQRVQWQPLRLGPVAQCLPEDWLETDRGGMTRDHHRSLDWAGDGLGHQYMCWRSEEHTSELQSLMRTSYAVLC